MGKLNQIGYFGKIKFYSGTDSSKKAKPQLQSFNNMTWNTSINISEHKRSGKKPLVEVTSKNLDEITMTIYFLAQYGVKPWKMLKQLRSYNLNAKVFALFIGGRRVGSFKFLITNVSNEMKAFYRNGKITGFAAQVTFKEYPYVKSKSKKKKIVSSKSKSKKKKKKKSGSDKKKKTGSKSRESKIKKGYQAYVVKKGDTLWNLAVKFYGKGSKYVKIYNANKTASSGFDVIKNPEKISPGQIIKIPD